MTRRRHWKPPLDLPLHALFWLALLLALDGTGVVRLSLLCALLHESGHVAVYLALFHRPPCLKVSPTGICLSMRGVLLPSRRALLLAAAGPLMNLLCCASAIFWMELAGYSYRGYWFASVNLLLGTVNLLPLPGLDGQRIVEALLQIPKK